MAATATAAVARLAKDIILGHSTRKMYTLLLLVSEGKVLLGYKKRGFGSDRWNGFGGKVEIGETVVEAARREMIEESGVTIAEPKPLAVIGFTFDNKPAMLQVHVFKATEFSGEPVESDEMRPEWFDADAVPFSRMWPDDILWFPYMWADKPFIAMFEFTDESGYKAHVLNEVTQTELDSFIEEVVRDTKPHDKK